MEFKELKEKLLKLFEETDRQETYILELRQRLSLAEKVCFAANGYLKKTDNGYLKKTDNSLGKIYLERLEDAVEKWDDSRPNKGAQYVVTEEAE